jgi:predicted transcriptional regulator
VGQKVADGIDIEPLMGGVRDLSHPDWLMEIVDLDVYKRGRAPPCLVAVRGALVPQSLSERLPYEMTPHSGAKNDSLMPLTSINDCDMSNALDRVVERVKSWPEARQRDVLRVLEVMEQSGTAVHMLTDDERAAVQVGLDQANRGEFVSDAEMEAFWRRNRA